MKNDLEAKKNEGTDRENLFKGKPENVDIDPSSLSGEEVIAKTLAI